MANKTIKISLLGLLLIMFMSVAMAAEVTEDTTNEVAIPSTETIEETTKVVETENIEQVTQTRSYNPINTDTVINDSTWDNQVYDVSSNVKITTNISQSNNVAFNLNGNNITIDGLNIVNDETQPLCINITSGSYDINILNCNITMVNTEESQAFGIYMENSSNVSISNSNISLSAVSQPLYIYNSSTGWYDYSLKVASIVVDSSSNVTIDNNKFYLTNSTVVPTSNGGTGNVILMQNGANNISVTNNNIEAENYPYTYAISSAYSNNIYVENNTISLTGTNYICGVQFSSTSNSIARRNTITGTCSAVSGTTASYEAFAYGIISITGTWGAPASEAVGNIICNNDVTLDSTIAYAYELSNAEDNILCNNTANVNGTAVMALGIYNSTNCNITGNTFDVYGHSDSLNDSIYDAVYPETTGIKIVDDDSDNIRITFNTITVTESTNNVTFAIILEDVDGNYVTNNTLKSSWLGDSLTGDDAVNDFGSNTVEYNS